MRKLILISIAIISIICTSEDSSLKSSNSISKLKHIKFEYPSLSENINSQDCPKGMTLVSGSFCKNPREECEKWLDPESSIIRRCQKYKPSTCSVKINKNFCMDIEEHGNKVNDKPLTNLSWTEAKNICSSENKRLCTEDEWSSACEGNQSLPYPYGYERRSDWCNIDKMNLVSEKGEFIDKLEPISSNPKCLSPFGIHNMTGNADEFVVCSHGNYPFRSCEMGGWWGPVRNRCRATTYGHDEFFREIQIGFRCCAEVAH